MIKIDTEKDQMSINGSLTDLLPEITNVICSFIKIGSNCEEREFLMKTLSLAYSAAKATIHEKYEK